MARVFPGQDFEDVYNARNIYTSNIQGDDYKVRRSANDSNLDPRTNSQYQKKIVDAFSLASRIWSNKRECWKDHFRRGHKLFRYNEYEVDKVSKDLSGYQLAMNILINSLKTESGQFYDPQCFCITPTDIFGEPLNTYSILDILQHSKLDYSYIEKKLTFDALQPEGKQFDRFRSSVDPDPATFEKCLLTSTGCVPRDNTLVGERRDITLVNQIVQWPNFYFVRVDDLINPDFGLWDHENFTYEKLRTEDLPVTDGSMRAYTITVNPPRTFNSLCGIGNLQLTLYTQYENMWGLIQYTGVPPFFDIYYGDNLLGRYGSGGGQPIASILNLNQDFNTTPSERHIKWTDHIYPVIPGYQPNMYPPGKLTECRLREVIPVGGMDERCIAPGIIQIWEAPEPIDFIASQQTVRAMVNIWCYGAGSAPPVWNTYPYGALRLFGSNDKVNWEQVTGANIEIGFDGVSPQYCWGQKYTQMPYNQSFKWFATRVTSASGGAAWGETGTLIGDTLCKPTPITELCDGPGLGCRGLFFLEQGKEFVRRPVACRCPEFSCPTEFPETGPNGCTLSNIRRCPDDPMKALIGDECFECVGSSPRGLVYDYLR